MSINRVFRPRVFYRVPCKIVISKKTYDQQRSRLSVDVAMKPQRQNTCKIHVRADLSKTEQNSRYCLNIIFSRKHVLHDKLKTGNSVDVCVSDSAMRRGRPRGN